MLFRSEALRRSQQYLSEAGALGSVSADPAGVTVTVRESVTPLLLGLFGVGGRTIAATRTATPVDR